MDPATIAAMMNGASGILKGLQPTAPQTQPMRADGYALGGTALGSNDGAATGTSYSGAQGSAYGGAYSQANVDGSNWVVATGKSSAQGWGRSGENGGLNPMMNYETPKSPFLQPAVALGAKAADSLQSSGSMLLIGLAILAVVIIKK